jgi:hypothetical protein
MKTVLLSFYWLKTLVIQGNRLFGNFSNIEIIENFYIYIYITILRQTSLPGGKLRKNSLFDSLISRQILIYYFSKINSNLIILNFKINIKPIVPLDPS